MGWQIAVTGLVLFIFAVLVGGIALKPPRNTGICVCAGWTMIVGGLCIPIGIIIQIWQ